MTKAAKTSLATFTKDEEVAFLFYKEVLEEAFKTDGLRAVFQMSQDAVDHTIFVAQASEAKGLSMRKQREAVAATITTNWTPAMLKFLAGVKEKGGIEALVGKE